MDTPVARQGFRLFLQGRDAERVQRLAQDLKADDAIPICADLQSVGDIEELFAQIARHSKTLDLLVNNAFGKLETSITDADSAEIQRFFEVSLAGTAIVIQKAVPFLRSSQAPQIVNIVADWGVPMHNVMHNVMTGPAVYVAAKYGMYGLGVALQVELAKLGIRTTNICPGVIAADQGTDTPYEEFEKSYGDTAIHPESIASAIDFVLAQRSAHVRSVVLSPRNPDYNGL
jgi:NADP-dependent 3-hydroxy acid dehydrogenase YdfG